MNQFKNILKNPNLIYLLILVFIIYIINVLKSTRDFVAFNNDIGSTLSDLEAINKADLLESSMNKMGTDEDSINNILENLTRADFNKVYDAFGLRPYFPELGYSLDIPIEKEYNLIEWLMNELNSSEIEDVEEILGFSLL